MTAIDAIELYARELAELAELAACEVDDAIDALVAARDRVEAARHRAHVAADLAERWLMLAARAREGVADPWAIDAASLAIASLIARPEAA